MIILYSSFTGDAMRLAKRFEAPSKELELYNDKDSEEILFIARKILIGEDLSFLKVFVHKNRDKISGVVIHDDKFYGDEYGEAIRFFASRDIKILRVWDKMVSDEEIKSLEDEMDGTAE